MEMLLQLVLGLLLLAANYAPAIAIPSPQCQKQCGNVEIPYPFGIGVNCSLSVDFNISCQVQEGISKPFNGDFEVLNISLSDSTMRVLNYIVTYCYNATSNDMEVGGYSKFDARDTPYRFSDVHNKFTVIGCNTLAYIFDSDNDTVLQSGCVSTCGKLSVADGSFSGMGYCQTVIPRRMDYYSAAFDIGFNTSQISSFSRCSYAVLMEAAAFNFSTLYVNTTKFNDTYAGRAPMVLNWAIRNETSCEVAKRNKTASYACLSGNSECVDSTNGAGYVCTCSKGYQVTLIFQMDAKITTNVKTAPHAPRAASATTQKEDTSVRVQLEGSFLTKTKHVTLIQA